MNLGHVESYAKRKMRSAGTDNYGCSVILSRALFDRAGTAREVCIA